MGPGTVGILQRSAVTVPVFINCRDRLAPLQELVSWLERAGVEEIYFLDNDSAFEPLLEYYRTTPHTVVRMQENFGKHALWIAPGVIDLVGDRPFVYTDPDVVPSPECPLDALDHFAELLERYPGVTKAGFGLRIDDIPEHYPHRDAVIAWEGQMWQWPLGDGNYFAAIDSTFALHRPGAGLRPSEAVRTGPPYLARHTTWYVDMDSPTEEDLFYSSRPGTRGNWNKDELPDWLAEAHEVMLTAKPSRLRMAVRRAKLWPYLHWTLRGRPLPRGLAWASRWAP
ncbi:MAG: hypothetical protein QOE29_2309 [Gaiellaceae bacterium]|nr:hypothetical protein [Gaiellaceae bacterium]